MPNRGLRKTSTRRSLRPRNHTTSSGGTPAVRVSSIPAREILPRTAADTETGARKAFSRTLSDEETAEREDFEDSAAQSGAEDGHEPAESNASEAAGEHHASSVAHSVASDDPLANAFFERSSETDEVFDDNYVIHQLSRGSRRAMYASLGIFAVSIVCIGTYTVYQNWVMPAPVELGATVADIPAVPVPDPAHLAPASVRWHAAQLAPQVPARAAASESAPGTETQLSAATQLPVQFDVQGSAKSALRMNAAELAAAQPAAAQLAAAQPSAAQPGARPSAAQPAAAQLAAQPSAAQPAAQLAATRPAAASSAAAQPAAVQAAGVQFAAAQPTSVAQPAAAQLAAAQPAAAAAQGAPTKAPAPAEAQAATKPVDLTTAARESEPVQVASAAELDRPSGGLPTSASGGPTYDELVAVGRALSKKNKRVEASEAFRRALVQSPQGSAALSGLGYVFLNADEKQNAREYAQRAVLADASNAEGWIVLGAALELLGDRAGARDAYRKCVERGQGPYLTECRRVAH
jgi:tetratricopeptide (TPR) repeat protein